MFAKLNDLDYIGIKLTYIRQGKEKEQYIDQYVFNYLELEQFVVDLIGQYLEFYNIIFQKIEKRNKSYALCVNEKKKSEPIIIEYKYDNGDLVYRIERDKKALLEVYYDVYKNSSKPYGM